ncbi:MAG TPA: GntR family transcriptional regulator [Streptosporangiaceae bacterium]|jgi:GntR family transcriptional regulator|nr:GntR family transcriptional regulator [Streptosporangiaceae bacterium]
MAEPMYKRVAEDLRGRIESGEIAQGSKLPTEVELMDEYGEKFGSPSGGVSISRNTVRDAIKLLATRGLVVSRAGKGTFVVRKIDPFVSTLSGSPEVGRETVRYMSEVDSYGSEVEASGRKPDVSVPRVEVQRASGWVASLLALAEGTMVISRYQERSIDETPWSMQTTFYPMDWVNRGASRLLIAENITDGIIRYVEDILGVKQVGLHDLITARVANSHESAFFDLPEDGQVAVFEVSRVGFDENSSPLRLTVTVYPADRNYLAYDEGQVPANLASLDVSAGASKPKR